jgi:hypothetical protein
MKSDPIIDEVRRIRCNISRQFDNDPKKLVAHYMAIQNKRKDCSEKSELPELRTDRRPVFV